MVKPQNQKLGIQVQKCKSQSNQSTPRFTEVYPMLATSSLSLDVFLNWWKTKFLENANEVSRVGEYN